MIQLSCKVKDGLPDYLLVKCPIYWHKRSRTPLFFCRRTNGATHSLLCALALLFSIANLHGKMQERDIAEHAQRCCFQVESVKTLCAITTRARKRNDLVFLLSIR